MKTVANDNSVLVPYQIREGRNRLTGNPQWYVANPHCNAGRRISVYFPTPEQAERARDVLITDDQRRQA